MKKLFQKIINPIRLIESESINFKVGFWKSICVILLWVVLSSLFSYIATCIIPSDLLINNIYILGIIELLLIPLLCVILVYTFGRNNNMKNLSKKLHKKTLLYLSLSIVAYRLLYNALIFPLLTLIPINEGIEVAFQSISSSLIYLILTLCISAPIIEEIVCRGIILGGFLKKFSPNFSIFLSALIFAVMHGNIHQGINAFILGLFFGYIYYKTKSLYLTMFCHFINNTFVLLSSPLDFTLIFDSYIGLILNLLLALIISIPLIRLIKRNLTFSYNAEFIYTKPILDSNNHSSDLSDFSIPDLNNETLI